MQMNFRHYGMNIKIVHIKNNSKKSKPEMACFFCFMQKKMNIKKPGQTLKFGFKVKKFNQVSKFCSEIRLFRGGK